MNNTDDTIYIDEFLSNQKTLFLNKSQEKNLISTNSNNYNNQTPYITIGTHNIRGINRETDQANLIMELLERKIDIMGLYEIKLAKEHQHFTFADQRQYKCFSSAEPNNPGVQEFYY